MNKLPSVQRLSELLKYDRDTGVFVWRKKGSGVRPDMIAGTIMDKGYRRIKLGGVNYLAHRLAWVFVKGEIPAGYMIDHINMQKDDNRICNLRLATHAENQFNRTKRQDNTSGLKGVSWHKRRKKFQAQIGINGTRKGLGYFSTAEEAHEAYKKASLVVQGDFRRDN